MNRAHHSLRVTRVLKVIGFKIFNDFQINEEILASMLEKVAHYLF